MLAVTTWILLLCVAASTVTYMIMTTFFRKRREGEPMLAKGSLIWGNAADFAEHAVDFLHTCQRSYGDVFTIRLINQYLTIIMDPHSYEAVSKEKNFDFDPIQKQVNWNVFSFVLKEPVQMIKNSAQTVRGPKLHSAVQSFVSNLKISLDRVHPKSAYRLKTSAQEQSAAEAAAAVAEEQEQEESRLCHINSVPPTMGDTNINEGTQSWASEGLRVFTARTMFDAIFNNVFGRADGHAFNSEMVFRNFEIFHKYFNYFWLGMPKSFFPPAMRALESLLVMPNPSDLEARSDLCDYIRSAMDFMRDQGQTDADMKGHNLVYLHVNYNTFRLAFWALNNLLEDTKAQAALRDEVEQAIFDRLHDQTNTATFGVKDVEDLPVLNSIVNETMRMASGVFMVRYITEDTQFTTSSGKSYLMRKGDRVAMYPPAIHKDPEIYQNPLEFKYDRFVDAKFYKNGEELKHPIIAFGSLCPGKRYATIQLKWFILNIISKFDLVLKGDEHAQYDNSYHGHEVLPPVKDVPIDFRCRGNAPTLDLDFD